MIIDERLVERGFGSLEGGSYNEKYTHDFWNYYLNKNDYGVEPLQDLFFRTQSFLEYLKNNYIDKTILIVSHAATIRAYILILWVLIKRQICCRLLLIMDKFLSMTFKGE